MLIVPESKMARLEGFEPPTFSFEGCRSIHLSYRRVIAVYPKSLHKRSGRPATNPRKLIHLTLPPDRSDNGQN